MFAEIASAQLVVVPIKSSSPKKKSSRSARAQLPAMQLPFWDDFSLTEPYPNDTLWQYGASVSATKGMGINPPTLGVATFDGLDSAGRPYDITNALAKGYADSLVSRAIRLDLVDSLVRPSVYLSFYYEFMGNGEAPNPGDKLSVEFLNDQGKWELVWSVDTEGTDQPDTFKVAVIPVADKRFFHASFQFRFRNFGRLSGPYDTWNVDYVYLNSGRNTTDTSFPDRAIATPLTSFFTDYWSIPKKHFLRDIEGNLGRPSFTIYNLRVNNIQPLNYSYFAKLTTYKQGAATEVNVELQDSTTVGNGLTGLERRTVTVDSTLSASLFDPSADSFRINVRVSLSTKDNVPPADNGDYIAAKYAPIDFRVNDTTRAEYFLQKYYAYDDGTAEYGVGLNQPGGEVAYRYDMRTPSPDTVVAVDFYFPHFGDESSQLIDFQILSDLTDNPQSVLYEENIPIQRSEQNKFIRHPLTLRTVLVQGNFYMGWKQTASVVVPIGWDKNTDSGDRIYVNTNGTWEQNTIEHGSIMMRPVFGKGGVVTGLPPDTPPLQAFPNPSNGSFYLTGSPGYIEVIDLAGKPVDISREAQDDRTYIRINAARPGLYILKAMVGTSMATQKILVRPE